ncbi:MAG TPA: GxxExxY protein [Candidatus Hydrogenedentes bacterium]|nr:GxxExxY protein [Candidatus Hydrogenedentota bacterium]HOS03179.1 GxxExxY protein [Candidatus Hydrogenedentota bacterium]
MGKDKDEINELSFRVIGAAIEVHRELGPGLLESTYEECLCRELELQHIGFRRQVPLAVTYKGIQVECSYRMDLVIEDSIVVELKAIEQIDPIHEAQLLTYLRHGTLWLGLLINFNVTRLKDGITRIVNG